MVAGLRRRVGREATRARAERFRRPQAHGNGPIRTCGSVPKPQDAAGLWKRERVRRNDAEAEQ